MFSNKQASFLESVLYSFGSFVLLLCAMDFFWAPIDDKDVSIGIRLASSLLLTIMYLPVAYMLGWLHLKKAMRLWGELKTEKAKVVNGVQVKRWTLF